MSFGMPGKDPKNCSFLAHGGGKPGFLLAENAAIEASEQAFTGLH